MKWLLFGWFLLVRATRLKINNKKNGKTWRWDYFLSTYHYAISIVFQQLPSFIDLKKTHNNMHTSYCCCLLSITHVDSSWLLPTICNVYRPFVTFGLGFKKERKQEISDLYWIKFKQCDFKNLLSILLQHTRRKNLICNWCLWLFFSRKKHFTINYLIVA